VFVVFEGIDGSGKTTLSNAVAQVLRERGRTVKHLRADGKFSSQVTEAIRTLGRDARNLDLVPRAEFLLYVAREVQLMEEALAPALRDHDVVIADRFLHTAEVLGQAGRKLPAAFVRPVLEAALSGFEPDLVLLVDVDPGLARARRRAAKLLLTEKKPPSRKGLTGVGLQHRLRRGYLELAEANPRHWVVVDNDETLAASSVRVAALIESALVGGAAPAALEFHARATKPPASVRPLELPEEALEAFLAWIDRRIETEPAVAAYLLSGLFGPRIEPLFTRLAAKVPEAVLSGIRGQSSEATWKLRETFKTTHPAFVARSLNGLTNTEPRAALLREELFDAAPREVVASLGAALDDGAWALRYRLAALHPDALVAQLGTIHDERAWELRIAYLARHGASVAESYELAVNAARSVTGLDDERAWKIRELTRDAAPIAMLRSVTGVEGPRSWVLRERYLNQAPKAVMTTLTRLRDDRAWAMRAAVAKDCKEALDGISGMPDDGAWTLRDAYLDVWPSTVVKSLGPLADEPRGAALVRRQLVAHGNNLSLLKHAAAIALGAHRFTIDHEE
jgi:dTMP kinase